MYTHTHTTYTVIHIYIYGYIHYIPAGCNSPLSSSVSIRTYIHVCIYIHICTNVRTWLHQWGVGTALTSFHMLKTKEDRHRMRCVSRLNMSRNLKRTHVCWYTRMYTYVYKHIHLCIYMYTFVNICTYTAQEWRNRILVAHEQFDV